MSTNYDADADSDDGSCVYPIEQADGILGGKLFDKFWATETGWTAPTGIVAADISGYSDFYRCKACHGWDLDGNVGAYINRGATASRPSVSGSIRSFISSSTDQALFDAIKNTGGAAVDPARTANGTDASLGGNAHPDYGTILTDDQIWALAKFLKTEAIDVTTLYDVTVTGTYPTGTATFSNIGKDGDAAAGNATYTSKCVGCHGADGTTIALEGKSVGQFTRSKANEAQHKIKFGQLGSTMGAMGVSSAEMKDLYKALSDETAFPDL
ncbi:MAG: c-type cytochrome [Flavobacteriales bacterium]|nr:c-type cytochrome [Flavobacteriales bacterium]